MAPILGCIADDYTGATDLANMLVRGGLRTVQLLGVPEPGDGIPEETLDVEAVVIALKSRTVPVSDAVNVSCAALEWLRRAGAQQFLFKYCSTFDSTDTGNIGPVTEALMQALETDFTIACPAFPETGRTIFKGHLFVGDQLLSDSPMRDHPLTPMTDSNLVDVLARQMTRPVGLVQCATIDAGVDAIRDAFAGLRAEGVAVAIVDAVSDAQLHRIGRALAGFPLVTGGSGIAIGLPETYRRAGLLTPASGADTVPAISGPGLVLSGSCSTATRAQVDVFAAGHEALRLDPLELAAGSAAVDRAIGWAREHIGLGPVLVHAGDAPDRVRSVQQELGRDRAGMLVEQAMARIAVAMVGDGVRRLVVAGGETSGAVVGALGIRGLRIGRQIDPGVPSTVTIGEPGLALALKSGNFGGPDFFAKALARMG